MPNARAACALSAIAMLTLAAGTARAQDSATTDPAAVPEPPPGQRDLLGQGRLTIRGQTTFSLNTELDDDGDSSVGRVGAGASYATPITRDVFVNLSYDVEFSMYDFDNATGLAPDGDPVDSTYEHTLSLGLNGQFDPAWGWFGGGGVKIAAEAGASSGDIYRPVAFGGVTYRFSDALSIGAGVGFSWRYEDSVRVLPLIQVDWRIDERWRFSAGRTIITEGPTAAIFYRANDETELFFGGGYNYREFRMDDDGIAPDGVFRDSRVPILAGVDWQPTPNIRLIAGGGVTVYQEYEILDSDGDELTNDESDPAGMLFLRLSASF